MPRGQLTDYRGEALQQQAESRGDVMIADQCPCMFRKQLAVCFSIDVNICQLLMIHPLPTLRHPATLFCRAYVLVNRAQNLNWSCLSTSAGHVVCIDAWRSQSMTISVYIPPWLQRPSHLSCKILKPYRLYT